MTFNTALLFVLLNLGAAGLLAVLPDPQLEGAMTYGLDKLARVYPERSEEEIRQLLQETWSRTYLYEPFTQFKEAPVSGRYVNVTPHGYRAGGSELPWPPAADRATVFVFGGSTAFGYGVADDETIPSQLHDALARRCGREIAVYNFARSNYFSSQERILFQALLSNGFRPNAAVFLDGLNEFGHPRDEPKFTPRLAYLMDETPAQLTRRWAVGLPLARLVKRWLRRPEISQREAATTEQAGQIVARWLANRELTRAAATAAGVDPLFVWQPIPDFGYDLDHHLFVEGSGGESASSLGYTRVDDLRRKPDGPLGDDFLWLADLQRGRSEPLYVDQVHYTAAFSREIAEAIAGPVADRLCQTQ